MPEFILHANKTVAVSSGHRIEFKKGEPTFVPPVAIAEVMAIGAIPVDDDSVVVADDETPVDVPLTLDERKAKITAAFKTLQARNERGDFDGAGKAHPKAITLLVGFQVETKERNKLWDEYMEAGDGS